MTEQKRDKEKKGYAPSEEVCSTCSIAEPPVMKDRYTCPVCNQRFENPADVIRHVFRDHAT